MYLNLKVLSLGANRVPQVHKGLPVEPFSLFIVEQPKSLSQAKQLRESSDYDLLISPYPTERESTNRSLYDPMLSTSKLLSI